MAKRNYNDWTKEDLVKEIEALKKQKTYGLVWEQEKTKEIFDYYINWDGIRTKEIFKDSENKFPVLKEIKSKTIINDKNDNTNLLIEGDNYHSLATLSFTHNKSIDVIYIDPPYNTGAKTWRYNNDYVEKDDAYRHSKWLSFMSKRLQLAYNLLPSHGFLICAIDENELFTVGLLLDEIFGEKNRLGLVTVLHNPKGRNQSKFFSANSEFMLVYARNADRVSFNKVALNEDVQVTFDLEDEQGKYRLEHFMRARTVWSRQNRPLNWYPIFVSRDLKNITSQKVAGYYEVYPITNNGGEMAWKNIKETFDQLNDGDYFTAKKEGEKIRIYHKYREQQVLKNVWLDQKYQSEFHGTNLLKKILGKNIFDYPKSLYLLIDILKLTTKKDSVILDFFAGSGTTGHAVLELNKIDNGKRRFILCTNNEGNICTDVCYPRIANVINGYKRNGEIIAGLGGNLRYFQTSFVNSSPTDANKKTIVQQSTEMLCIKEGAFELVMENNGYKIFKNNSIYLGIIFNDESIDYFVNQAKSIDGKFNVYVFSLDDTVPNEEFKDIKEKINLCPIPEVILHVYRRIFKND